MDIFSNQATLTYNGNSTNSNIAYGEILDVLAATTKSYRRKAKISVLSLENQQIAAQFVGGRFVNRPYDKINHHSDKQQFVTVNTQKQQTLRPAVFRSYSNSNAPV